MSDTDIHDYSNELELLQFIPPSPFWMCETILCGKLGFIFDRGEALTLPDDCSVFPDMELLSLFVKKLQFGKVSCGRRKIGFIDLSDGAPNDLCLNYHIQYKIKRWNKNGTETINRRRFFCRYDVSIILHRIDF